MELPLLCPEDCYWDTKCSSVYALTEVVSPPLDQGLAEFPQVPVGLRPCGSSVPPGLCLAAAEVPCAGVLGYKTSHLDTFFSCPASSGYLIYHCTVTKIQNKLPWYFFLASAGYDFHHWQEVLPCTCTTINILPPPQLFLLTNCSALYSLPPAWPQ